MRGIVGPQHQFDCRTGPMDPDLKQQGFMVLTPTVSKGPSSLYRIPVVFIINSIPVCPPTLTTVGTLSQWDPIVRPLTRSAFRFGTRAESREDRPVSSSLHVVVGLLRTPSSSSQLLYPGDLV
jgi:hypothetical protein